MDLSPLYTRIAHKDPDNLASMFCSHIEYSCQQLIAVTHLTCTIYPK